MSVKMEGGNIAVVGLGCRFPGADNPECYWHLLHNGFDAIGEVPSERWDVDSYYDQKLATAGKMNTRWGGFLQQVDNFDADFFGISPREAERIDPQQRLLLEVTWESLENASISPSQLSGSQTGVFIGISNSDYGRMLFEDVSKINAYHGTGSAFCIAANRISYFLNLKGPSLAIDTACSSSLVSVHYACQSLLSGESNLCLAGGVNLILSPEFTINFSQARMMAADGRCKTFDDRADGYVRGEGCGIVVLKRLSDAIRDGDNIRAIIKGSAINQDGLTNGLTAPNGPSQQAVIRQALKKAGVKPSQISYVEAHGTGTSLGDPQEIKSLKAVLLKERQLDQPCWISSVKTNIGHLESAAGIAGLIKVILSLQNKTIPPHLHLEKLNRYISLEGTPLDIPTKPQPWEIGGEPRLAGISSFGFGGTNAHVILAEWTEKQREKETKKQDQENVQLNCPLHLLTLSAKNEPALKELASRYAVYLDIHADISLADVCFTANTGRTCFNYRLAAIASSKTQLKSNLAAFAKGEEEITRLYSGFVSNKRPKIAFLFTGQGSQYVGMGKQLYETEPVFRSSLDHCAEILSSYLDKPLLEVLYPSEGETSPIDETEYTQPALFALEYALYQLWMSWGIKPSIVIGHSVGEYVAACVAGVFGLEDGLKLIAHRGRLMQSLPHNGKMASVLVDENTIKELIAPYENKIAIAAYNGLQSIVISGEKESIESVISTLETREFKVKPLNVSHAFHSSLMQPIIPEFREIAESISYCAPQIDLISNVTGKTIKSEIANPEYWCDHILKPVRFAASFQEIQREGYKVFLEIGPKPILLGMGKLCVADTDNVWIPSLRPQQSDLRQINQSLGELFVTGAKINWQDFYQNTNSQKIELPTYAFQRQRYWFDVSGNQVNKISPESQSTILQLISEGKTEKLISQLENESNLSSEQKKLLPELLDLLVQKHQQELNTDEYSEISDYFYEVNWIEKPCFNNLFPPDYLPTPSEIAEKIKLTISEQIKSKDLDNYAEAIKELEVFSKNYIVQAFKNIGWCYQVGEQVDIKTLISELGIHSDYERLLKRLLQILEEEEYIELSSQAIIVKKLLENINDNSEDIDRLRNKYPQAQAEITLTHYCGSNLSGVLRGETDPVELVFPNGDLTLTTELYQDSPTSKLMNKLIGESLKHILEKLPSHRGIKILEIGAGTGGTTSHILPLLNPVQTEYVFTDLGTSFTQKAQSRFADYPFVSYQTLDIEKDPLTQGFEANQYDLVIASNVIHATTSLNQSLSNIKKLISPHGILVLWELTDRQRWVDLIFGLLEGWWRFQDTETRADYPLLNQSQWQQLLTKHNFTEVSVLPNIENQPSILSKQAVIIAQNEAKRQTNVTNPTQWLILADPEGVAEQLARELRSRGDQCTLVFAGNEYEEVNSELFNININLPEDFQKIVNDLAHQSNGIDGVIQCWSLETGNPETMTSEDLERLSYLGCGTTLYLLQALIKAELSKQPKLWLITQGSQPVPMEQPLVDGVAQSSLWGMGKVIALEHPEFECVRVDLDPTQGVEEKVITLGQEICSIDQEDQVALRNNHRYVARLVRSQPIIPKLPFQFKADGTYLITGGLGGLGLLVAHWMVEKGAKNLVLLGRSNPSDETLRKIKEIEQLKSGVIISVEEADVSSYQSMSLAMSKIKQLWPPLMGVIHSAGVLEDGILQTQNWHRFEKVMSPKIQGSWNLHQLTKDQPLDFYIMFSSAASLLGSKGQANHSTANAFLDGLAYYCQKHEQTAISINWGTISELGEAFERGADLNYEKKGIRSITPSVVLETLEKLVGGSIKQIGVVDVNWSDWLKQNKSSPFLADWIEDTDSVTTKSAPTFLDEMQSALPEQKRGLLTNHVCHQLAQVLGLKASYKFDLKQGFFDLGLDSLMAIELRNKLQTTLSCSIPSTMAFDYPTIEKLVDYLDKYLQEKNVSDQSTSDQRELSGVTTEEEDSTIDNLSDEQVEISLLSKLDKLGY